MTFKLTALAILSLGLLACSLTSPQRSRASGYADGNSDTDTVQDYYQQKRVHEVQEAKQELGININGELTESQQFAIRSRLLLKRLEQNIPNELERRQYYSLKPYFQNDQQRISFLQLPTREAKDRYAVARG